MIYEKSTINKINKVAVFHAGIFRNGYRIFIYKPKFMILSKG